MNGKVIGIVSDVIDIKFGKNKTPKIGTVLKSSSGTVMTTEVVMSDTVVRAVTLSQNSKIAIGETVVSTKKPLQAPVGKKTLGRIFNVFGEVIDGKPSPKNLEYHDVEIFKNHKKDFMVKAKIIPTGIKVIDFFLPIVEGDKLGMFGGAGVGKTLVIKELINNLTKDKEDSLSIFVGIGERSREGEELYRELIQAKLIDKVSLVFAQMNDTPGARMKIIYSALTMAEFFRDNEKENTYMFIDNIYRFTQAGSEISSSLGKIPSQSGYQPTLQTEISNVQERITNSKKGTITAFETVFVPADDITDPSVVAIFSHLDGALVLDRKIAAEGKYPAISPLRSTSNNLTDELVGQRHVKAASEAKNYLQRFEELSDLLAVLGADGISESDREIVKRARMLSNFFTQNLFSASEFNKLPGDWVPLEEVINSVESIISGELDDIDPTEFLYIKNTENLSEKAKKIKADKELEKNKKPLSRKQRRLEEKELRLKSKQEKEYSNKSK